MQVYIEEKDTNRTEIKNAEKLWNTEFPNEFVDFLLKYNGVITYPNYPTVSSENNRELSGIERFLSIGDIVLQKKHPMPFSLFDIDEEYLEEYDLDPSLLLTFAIAERGSYFINLSQTEFGQIYYCNFSGGDGFVRLQTESFTDFVQSLSVPEGYEIDSKFILNPHHSSNKIFQKYLFNTPDDPKLGFNRFIEIFEIVGDIQPPEAGYVSVPQKYVDDQLKLEYLISKGCITDGLLHSSRNANTIEYLVNECGLDINKTHNGRYPLQNYLSLYRAKESYELIHKLLVKKISMDWSIEGVKVDSSKDLPMIEKLRLLHNKYIELELKEKEFQKKYNRPSGISPFIESTQVQEKIKTN